MEIEEEKVKVENDKSIEDDDLYQSDEDYKNEEDDEIQNYPEPMEEPATEWELNKEKINPELKALVENFSIKANSGPRKILGPYSLNAFGAFSLFFDQELLEYIGIQSNKYLNDANNHNKPKMKTYYEYYKKHMVFIGQYDIKAFLAISILMGLKKYPKQSDHWSHNRTYVDPKVSEIMTRDMYNVIKYFFSS